MRLLSAVYCSALAIILIFLLIEWYYKKLIVPFRFLACLILCTITVEVLSETIYGKVNNMFLYHFLTPVEYVLYALLFREIIVSKKVKTFISYSIPLFLIFAVLSAMFFQPLTENNGNVLLLESSLLIVYSLLYFRQLLLTGEDRRTELNPFFWLVTGAFLYFIQNFFIEGLLGNLIKISQEKARIYYRMGFVLKYLMCLLTFIAVWIDNKYKALTR